jgi:hypothetical protein
VSVVDAPPGLAFAGPAAGEFVARRASRRLARIVFYLVLVVSAAAFAIAVRRLYRPMAEIALVAPLMCVSIAAVGHAVRRARIRIDRDGVRWGWEFAGFRMPRARIRRVDLYRDAIALVPQRGSVWFLSPRDWERFEGMCDAVQGAGLPLVAQPTRAPLRARMQSYGLALDTLLLLDAIGSVLILAFALAL